MQTLIQILYVLIVLALFFLLARFVLTWQYRRAKSSILGELKAAQATTPSRAIPLDYHKPFWKQFGVRDYRPFVLKALVQAGIVRQTSQGKYYLSSD